MMFNTGRSIFYWTIRSGRRGLSDCLPVRIFLRQLRLVHIGVSKHDFLHSSFVNKHPKKKQTIWDISEVWNLRWRFSVSLSTLWCLAIVCYEIQIFGTGKSPGMTVPCFKYMCFGITLLGVDWAVQSGVGGGMVHVTASFRSVEVC
jgi:hypothetical protein